MQNSSILWMKITQSKLLLFKDCALAKAKQKNVLKQGTGGDKAWEPNRR
jgi:hypothetical protein